MAKLIGSLCASLYSLSIKISLFSKIYFIYFFRCWHWIITVVWFLQVNNLNRWSGDNVYDAFTESLSCWEQVRYTYSNGPLRVQSNGFFIQSILQRKAPVSSRGYVGISKRRVVFTTNSRWHRGWAIYILYDHSSLTEDDSVRDFFMTSCGQKRKFPARIWLRQIRFHLKMKASPVRFLFFWGKTKTYDVWFCLIDMLK